MIYNLLLLVPRAHPKLVRFHITPFIVIAILFGSATPLMAQEDKTKAPGKISYMFASVRPNEQCRAFAASPTGDLFAVGLENGDIRLWSIQKKEVIARVAANTGCIYSLVFTPDGMQLASIGENTENSVTRWAVPELKKLGMYTPCKEKIWETVALDSKNVAIPTKHELLLYDIGTDKVRAAFVTRRTAFREIETVSYSANAKLFALALTNAVVVLDSEKWGQKETIKFDPKSEHRFHAVALSRKGDYLAVLGDTMFVYELPSAKKKITLEDLGRGVFMYPSFSPSGNLLAVAVNPDVAAVLESDVVIWSLPSGRIKEKFRAYDTSSIRDLKFLDEGKLIGCSLDGVVKVWDIIGARTGKEASGNNESP